MKPAVDALRFATELAALAALAVAGAEVAWPLAVALPVAFALTWGRWVAPKSVTRLTDPGRLLLELALFAVASASLVATTSLPLGILLAVVAAAAAVATRRA